MLVEQRIKRYVKNTTALVLSLMMLCQTVLISALSPSDASYDTNASYTGIVSFGDVTLSQTQSLTDNGNDTYTLSLTLQSNLNSSDENENSQEAKNHYFTATQSGDYLVELWGGSGADGESTAYSDGGKGADGGHIYGVVTLQAGQTLFYTLGGHGVQTSETDYGGGANGEGGSHGDIGSYKIGGGGGYSAVYLFEPGEFESKYLTDSVGSAVTISKSDMTSKYIMIAGGGGGGGAGNGMFTTSLVTGTPDGGEGGSVGSNYGVLQGSEYDVEGTFFAGSDGKSSGTSTEYVGHGATNVPGSISSTITTWFNVDQPNDWKATYNTSASNGAGGAGNLRGGGGGAGFCGGSGGIMEAIFIAAQVGGGGGGSSFIADGIKYSDLDDGVLSQLLNFNPSDTGGAVNITYLGQQESANGLFDISGSVSDYFTVIGAEGAEIGADGSSFSVSGAALTADADQGMAALTVTLLLAPKGGFAGGNNVPLLRDNSIKCTMSTSSEDEGISSEILLDDSCAAVNVPLNFQVDTESLITNSTDSYKVSELYTDDYAAIREELADGTSYDFRFDFIDSISKYTVTDEDGAILQDGGTVSLPENETRRSFTVSLTVTPKTDSVAAVGKPATQKTFTGIATLSRFVQSSATLNGAEMNYVKELSYDKENDQYCLSLTINASKESSYTMAEGCKAEHDSGTSSTKITYEVPQSGYYMVQVWGGNGGTGGSYLGASGGSGGTGGYLSAIVYLENGTYVNGSIGANGSDGSRDSGGSGGKKTSVWLGDGESNPLMVAGGGGGGGASLWLVNGKDGSDAGNSANGNGSDGSDGGSASFMGGAGGTAGTNYLSSAVTTDAGTLTEEAQTTFNSASTTHTSKSGGAIYITPLQIERDGTVTRDSLSGYTAVFSLSDYFTLVGISYDNVEDCTEKSSGQNVTVSGINPNVVIEETAENGVTNTVGSTSFTVKLQLKVTDGFLGGNDVPLLEKATLTQNEESVEVEASDNSDYANVSIRYPSALDISRLSANTVTYIKGDEPIAHSALYSYADGADSFESVANSLNDRQTDYVTLIVPESENGNEYAPSENTTVPITVGVSPKVTTPQKATVGTVAVEETYTKNAVIEVLYRVSYDLTDITTQAVPNDGGGGYITAPHQAYTTVLTANRGAELPVSITVLVGAEELSSSKYSYDSTTGEILIPADQVTDNITIIAVSDKIPTYYIHYVYATDLSGSSYEERSFEYEENAAIGEKFSDSYEPARFEGYEFVWDWGEDESLETMPSRDIWVIGSYQPLTYTLTVSYVGEDGEVLFDDYTETLPYGSEYSIISPDKSGYLADKIAVSGTLTENTAVRVVYKPTRNQLNIIYVYGDSSTVISEYSESYETDKSYSVTSPEIDGYTPDTEVVSGVMTAEGVTEYVIYTPKSYTVTLDAAGGNCTADRITVVYNNIYSYNGESYSALPTPIRVGYEFTGWYLDGERVTEETKVQLCEDHTLTAGWRGVEYQLTVKYIYESGLAAELDPSTVTLNVEYGTQYSVTSPTLDGYTPDIQTVSGTMPAQNTVVNVTYYKNSFTLIMKYQYADGTQIYDDKTATVDRGQSYSESSPQVTGYTPDIPTVTVENIQKDTTVTVTYTKNTYKLTIHYVYEDGSVLFDDYTASFAYGEQYSVVSLEKDGYTPSSDIVSGVMGASNHEVTVIYYEKDKEPERIISVDIEWGNMTFSAEYSDWDPEAHSYDSSKISPITAGSNYVTVTNRSTVDVSVEVESSVDEYYGEIFNSFLTYASLSTQSGESGEGTVGFDLTQSGSGNNKTVYLWLGEESLGAIASADADGKLGDTTTVGKCTVTVSAID